MSESQPITTPAAVLFYGGRIDNRREIADRLGCNDLARAADGTVLTAAYAAWGEEFAAHVLGEYSFALIDRRTRRLVAARDSLGLGRLYHYDDGKNVRIASNLDLMLAALPARPPFDRDALAEDVAGGGLLASGRTIYDGIREVPAAHVLVHSDRSTLLRRYWQPDPERRLRLRGEGEYDELFRHLLFDAVEGALRSCGPVWCDPSGGLDSSTVAAVAAHLTNEGRGPTAGRRRCVFTDRVAHAAE